MGTSPWSDGFAWLRKGWSGHILWRRSGLLAACEANQLPAHYVYRPFIFPLSRPGHVTLFTSTASRHHCIHHCLHYVPLMFLLCSSVGHIALSSSSPPSCP